MLLLFAHPCTHTHTKPSCSRHDGGCGDGAGWACEQVACESHPAVRRQGGWDDRQGRRSAARSPDGGKRHWVSCQVSRVLFGCAGQGLRRGRHPCGFRTHVVSMRLVTSAEKRSPDGGARHWVGVIEMCTGSCQRCAGSALVRADLVTLQADLPCCAVWCHAAS